jgi:hypothetical protein
MSDVRWWRYPGERIVHAFAAQGTGWQTSRCGAVQWSPEMLWIRRPRVSPVGVVLDAAAAVRCKPCGA